jgi:hypothetical protein
VPSFGKGLDADRGHTAKKIKFLRIEEGVAKLKYSDNYMYQVQGLLHITQRKWCYFVVWTPHGMLVDKVERDDSFYADKMNEKLCTFYKECLLPEIIDSRKARELSIRDPPTIIAAQLAYQRREPNKNNTIFFVR